MTVQTNDDSDDENDDDGSEVSSVMTNDDRGALFGRASSEQFLLVTVSLGYLLSCVIRLLNSMTVGADLVMIL